MPIGGISQPTVNFCQFGVGNFRQLGSDFVGPPSLPVSITPAKSEKGQNWWYTRADGYISDNS